MWGKIKRQKKSPQRSYDAGFLSTRAFYENVKPSLPLPT